MSYLGVDFFEVLKNSRLLGIYIYQDGGEIVYANEAFLKMLDYSEDEIIHKLKVQEIIEGKNRSLALQNIERRLKGDEFSCEYRELYYRNKRGFLKLTLNFAYTITFQEKPAGLVFVVDITKSKVFERCYEILTELNQVVVRGEAGDDILENVCRIIYNHLDFHVVVLGNIDEKTKLFKPILVLGDGNLKEYFEKLKISVDESVPEGRGTVGRAYRTKDIAVSDNVFRDSGMAAWREAQKKFGVYSACSIPIIKKGVVEYIIILYSRIAGIFSGEYLSLLKEIQTDIIFALEKIESEKELNMLNEALRNSVNWVVISDEEGRILDVNRAVEEISGYKREELIGKNPRIFKSGYHTKDFYKKLYSHITKGEQFRCTFVNRRKDGSLFYLDCVIIPIVENGRVVRYIDISRDITDRVLAENRLKKMSNMFKTLYSINQLLLKTETENEVLDKLPKIIVEDLGFELAFLVDVKSEREIQIKRYEVKKNKYVAIFLLIKKILGKLPRGVLPPFVKSAKNKRIYIVNDILMTEKFKLFHKIARIFNFNAGFSMPIIKDEKVLAVLVGVTSQPHFFDRDIFKLLEQVKLDISYFLEKLETEKWYELFANAINKGFDFVVVTDDKFRILYVNDNVVKMSGYSKEELIGKHHSIFSSKTHSKSFTRQFYETLESGKTFSGVIVYRVKDSRFVKALMNITPYKCKDGKAYYIATGRDITSSFELQRAIEESLAKDPLTGLITRNEFLKSLKQFIDRASYEGLFGAVVVLNPIKFSAINHAYGFETGNKLLVKIAERLKKYFRRFDVVAKLESDKFGIIIKDIRSEEDIYSILSRLIEYVSRAYIVDGKKITLSFNVGVSVFPKDSKDATGLLEKAEMALMSVKNKEESLGFYKEEFKRRAKRIIELKTEVSEALENREFLLYYQPYLDVDSGNIAGAEALIRWRRKGKIVPPLEFIPYLEETGIITRVEEWIVKEVARKQKEWERSGIEPIPVSINISPESFSKQDYIRSMIDKVKEESVKPGLISVEIVERLFIKDLEGSKKILNNLKESGVKIAIDDFGTGYSSLSYISTLPIDFVKIDISFVRKMLEDSTTKAVVKTIISLCKDIGIKTIAEGVENKKQLDMLKGFGCDYVQGFLFYKPLPEDEFDKLLKVRSS